MKKLILLLLFVPLVSFGQTLYKVNIITDIDVNETMASGSTYANVSTEGTVLGIGYNRAIEGGLGVRIETSYMQLDDVSTNNGVSSTGATVANSGRNQVDVSNMEGLNAKLALTFTFGQ